MGTEIDDVGDGQYITKPIGDTYVMSCMGQRQVRDDLPIGVHLVGIDECTMTGPKWHLLDQMHQCINATARKPIKPPRKRVESVDCA